MVRKCARGLRKDFGTLLLYLVCQTCLCTLQSNLEQFFVVQIEKLDLDKIPWDQLSNFSGILQERSRKNLLQLFRYNLLELPAKAYSSQA